MSSSRLFLSFLQLTRRVKWDLKKFTLSSLSLILTFFSKGPAKESLLGSCFYRKWRPGFSIYIYTAGYEDLQGLRGINGISIFSYGRRRKSRNPLL